MKKPICLLLLVFMLSCDKDNSDNPTPSSCNEPTAMFKYKWNGMLYEMNGSLSQNAEEGSLIRKEQTTQSGASNPFDNANGNALNNTKYLYTIMATKNYYYSDDGEPIFAVELRTTTFTAPRTYSNNAGDIKFISFYHPVNAGESPAQPFTINITKVENGYADGNFNGNVIASGNQVIQITEGEFKNVKILQ